MRLLLITETFPPDRGGMAESCDRIVRGLTRAGVSIDLLHFDRRAAAPSFHETANGSILRFPLDENAPHTINTAWNRVRQTMDLQRVTHVVAFGGVLPIAAAPAFAAWIDRPLVTLVRGNEFDSGLFDPRRRFALDDALRRSAAICCVTSEQAEKIAALFPDAHVQTIANGIDFDLWQATDADRARAAAIRPDARCVLGLFGHLKSKKGAHFFFDAARALDAHLLLVGELEGEPPAELAVTQVAPLDRFDLIPYYLACDFVVLPSHYDGFPNVLIEAAALGRPLIASNVGGMRDLLTDGESALLFAAGDGHECRRAVARALAMSEDARMRMGACAQRAARERCDARDEARRYHEVLLRTGGITDAQVSGSRFTARRL